VKVIAVITIMSIVLGRILTPCALAINAAQIRAHAHHRSSHKRRVVTSRSMIAQLSCQPIGLAGSLRRSCAQGQTSHALATHAAQTTRLAPLPPLSRHLHVVPKAWTVRHPCQQIPLALLESTSSAPAQLTNALATSAVLTEALAHRRPQP